MKLIASALAGLIMGSLATCAGLGSRVPVEQFLAVEREHLRAVAVGDSLRGLASAEADRATRAGRVADSLRALRPAVVTVILSSPDSVGEAWGIEATSPDPETRCIPRGVYASLLADRAALHLMDSAGVWTAVQVTACLDALAYSDRAEAEARADALRLYEAGEALAGEVETLRRTRWMWAAGGALGGILLVIGIGAVL
jgi:hypothetical protein